jgi:hypothetical protein
MKGYMNILMTNMDNASAPELVAGSQIEINGGMYALIANESIGGAPTYNMVNYIYAVPGTGTATFSYSAIVPTYNMQKGGWYSGNNRAIARLFFTSGQYNGKVILDSYNAMTQVNTQQLGSTTSGLLIFNPSTEVTVMIEPGWYRIELSGGGGGGGGGGAGKKGGDGAKLVKIFYIPYRVAVLLMRGLGGGGGQAKNSPTDSDGGGGGGGGGASVFYCWGLGLLFCAPGGGGGYGQKSGSANDDMPGSGGGAGSYGSGAGGCRGDGGSGYGGVGTGGNSGNLAGGALLEAGKVYPFGQNKIPSCGAWESQIGGDGGKGIFLEEKGGKGNGESGVNIEGVVGGGGLGGDINTDIGNVWSSPGEDGYARLYRLW